MFKYSAKLLKGYADLKYDTFKKKKKSQLFLCAFSGTSLHSKIRNC